MADRSKQGPRVIRDPLLSYPLDELIRNPTLVPERDRPRLRALIEPALTVRSKLVSLGVLDGLSAEEQLALAAIVLDLDHEYEVWRSAGPRLPRLRRLEQRGPGHVRKLASGLDKVAAALLTLERDCKKVDVSIEERILDHVQRARRSITAATVELVPPRETRVEYLRQLSERAREAQRHTPKIDPRRVAALRLTRYLRKTVSRTNADAHVRAAKIGNARWSWDYVIKQDDYGELACEGVRRLLTRASPSAAMHRSRKPSSRQGTPSKK